MGRIKYKISFLFLILFASVQICSAQEKPQAVLFYKFGHVVEESFYAFIDTFLSEIQGDKNYQGYVVIHPTKNSVKRNFIRERRYETIIESKISLQKFDKNRIFIVRGDERDETEIELWKVPHGAEKPFSVEEKWAEILPDLSKAFVFANVYIDEIFPNFIPEFYADHIKNNGNLRGHIVIFNKSKTEALREANRWLKILTVDYKVPRNRFKVFIGKNNNSVDAEFWLVPQKKNK